MSQLARACDDFVLLHTLTTDRRANLSTVLIAVCTCTQQNQCSTLARLGALSLVSVWVASKE